MSAVKKWVFLIIDLTKFRISLFVTLSAGLGFVLAYQGLSKEMILSLLGVFLLASGACALNQYQERREDRKMERTKGRPIPSGRLTPSSALKISLSFLLLGFSILCFGTNTEALGLGFLAVLWYNGIYTPLKRRTVWAVLPGAFVGAIPPAIGWFSAGGSPDARILALSFFFFIWQIPHFWLLLLDYRRDYENAGLPCLTQACGLKQVERIAFLWIFATAVAGLLIPLFGIGNSRAILGGLMILGTWLIWKASKILFRRPQESPFRSTFRTVNIYILAVMVLFSLDHLLY
ncbi:MAG: protoheme IX farnesyltransferase [Deltaproteobacteria bacterium RBG_16_49_23]|nr:MAG: protoheme IX farnesyltransferase [Deltaproteobacteria bacterium RBG_16_49_23]